MKIEYELNKQDYIDLNIYHAKNSKVTKKALLIQRFLVPVIYLIIPFVLAPVTDIPLWYWFTAFAVVAVLWIAFYPRYSMRFAVRRISKLVDEGNNKDIFGKHSITVDENGIVGETVHGESKISWNGIERIVSEKEHFFIYINSVSAFVIPKRYFESEKAMDEFFQYVSGMLENK